jgi:hypothetical protein
MMQIETSAAASNGVTFQNYATFRAIGAESHRFGFELLAPKGTTQPSAASVKSAAELGKVVPGSN